MGICRKITKLPPKVGDSIWTYDLNALQPVEYVIDELKGSGDDTFDAFDIEVVMHNADDELDEKRCKVVESLGIQQVTVDNKVIY